MNYYEELYGKVGGDYVPLMMTSREVDELERERDQLKENAEQWQPIETAPKDGTEFIAWRFDCDHMIVRWGSPDRFMNDDEMEAVGMSEEESTWESWWYADFMQGGILEGSETPTHWMHLPDSP